VVVIGLPVLNHIFADRGPKSLSPPQNQPPNQPQKGKWNQTEAVFEVANEGGELEEGEVPIMKEKVKEIETVEMIGKMEKMFLSQ